ncbi:MAG TPA: hypothetical protein VMY37_04510 [Thermoguttaceae bacterium]|nr:hypothetical protein [Thermoguttaceae bacterium]
MTTLTTNIELVDLALDPLGDARYTCRDPALLYREAMRHGLAVDHWYGRANTYRCPRGKEPGRAWLLLSRRDVLGNREKAVDTGLDLTVAYALEFTYGTTTLLIDDLYIRDVRSLYADALDTSNETTMLVELVDKRAILQLSTINSQYNVFCPDPPADADASADLSDNAPGSGSAAGFYYAASLNAGVMWTWQTMLDNVWANLPAAVAGGAPVLPYTPNDYPRGFRWIGVSAWDVYHAVLDRLDCVLVLNPVAGTFSIVRRNAAQNLAPLDGDPDLQAAHSPQQGVAGYPETIRVFFPRREEHHGSEKEIQRTAGNYRDNQAYSKDVATGLTGAVAGTVLPVWDDMPAVYTFAGAHLNATHCDARAAEVAANTSARLQHCEEPRRRLYSGLKSVVLCGSEIAEIRWGDAGGGMLTEYRGMGLAREGECAGGNGEIARELLLPPDVVRRGWPDYPRLTQALEITNSTPVNGVYEAKLLRLDPEQDLADTPEYTNDVDVFAVEIDFGSLSDDARYLGRLIGTYKTTGEGAEARPLYLVGKRVGEAVQWAKIQSGFANATGATSHEVSVKTSWPDGTTETGAAFNVYTPIKPNHDTSLFTAYVVGYVEHAASGKKWIVTDCWDAPMCTVVGWNTETEIRDGWHELANQKGRYLRGCDPEDDAELGVVQVGATGGGLCHTHCQHGTNLFSYTIGSSTLYAFPDQPGACVGHIDPWLGIQWIERFE